MAFFPGQYNQAGGSWVDPSRLQTSQSGGAYIGGMAPQLPTQDMSFMWGGNGGAAAPAPAPAYPAAAPAPYQSTLTPQQIAEYNAMYEGGGNATWDAMDPALRAGIMSGNANVNMLTPEQRAAIPNSQVMYGMDEPAQQPTATSGGAPAPSLQSYTQSPYLAAMGQGLRDQFTGFMNDGLAANRGGAVAAGGVGGSRQGISEARTMTDAGKGFDSALANLYGQDYQAQMGRNLQKYQADQNFSLGNRGLDLGFQNSNNSYNLGLGSLDLQGRGQDMNFYGQQRAQDQSGAALGASLYGLGMQGPWNTLNSANGLASPYTSNSTQTSNTSGGGGWQGALGGGLGVAQLGKNFGWWG